MSPHIPNHSGKRFKHLSLALGLGTILISCGQILNWASWGSEDGDIKNLFTTTSGIPLEYRDPQPNLPNQGDLVLDVTNPKIMQYLEENGLQLGQIFALLEFGVSKKRQNNQDFIRYSPWYASVVKDLGQRIDQHRSTYGGVHLEEADLTDRPRIFSKKWFNSKYAHYELIAVVNRMDRMEMAYSANDLEKHKTNCGEVRFVYRMAYDHYDLSPRVFSRLPFNFNVVFEIPRPADDSGDYDACYQAAKRFKVPKKMEALENYLQWLKAGPFDVQQLRFKQLETNFQVVRITSGGKRTLGGHAEYIMAIHKPQGKQLVPSLLENTPDVRRIQKDPQLKREFIEFISENLRDIDRGVVQFPDKFLSYHAVSFATHGMHRLANRPFEQLLSTRDLAHIRDFNNTEFVNHIDSLVGRLDDLTCMGCHQSNSIAGFHLVGRDRAERLHPLNAAWVGESPHFIEERKRRQSYNWRLAHNEASPEQFAFRRLAFQKQKETRPTIGDTCITPADAKKYFKGHHGQNLTCDSTSKCVIFDKNRNFQPNIGTCMPKDDRPIAGLPCLAGSVVDQPNERDDQVAGLARIGCNTKGYSCLAPEEGTPGGMCYNRCQGTSERDSMETCAYNGGSSFDRCAASGNFASCIRGATSRGLRKACDAQTPCRDDFICQTYFEFGSTIKLASNQRQQAGFCVPTYFLFQMRLDGHPTGAL